MLVNETIRAWKDEGFRDTLTAEQRARVPEHPAGTIEFQPSDFGDEGPFGPVRLGNQYTTGTCLCTGKSHCR